MDYPQEKKKATTSTNASSGAGGRKKRKAKKKSGENSSETISVTADVPRGDSNDNEMEEIVNIVNDE